MLFRRGGSRTLLLLHAHRVLACAVFRQPGREPQVRGVPNRACTAWRPKRREPLRAHRSLCRRAIRPLVGNGGETGTLVGAWRFRSAILQQQRPAVLLVSGYERIAAGVARLSAAAGQFSRRPGWRRAFRPPLAAPASLECAEAHLERYPGPRAWLHTVVLVRR